MLRDLRPRFAPVVIPVHGVPRAGAGPARLAAIIHACYAAVEAIATLAHRAHILGSSHRTDTQITLHALHALLKARTMLCYTEASKHVYTSCPHTHAMRAGE